MMFDLQAMLAEISGFAAVTLQPAAGAQGELAGMLVVRAWHEAQGSKRRKVLIPDTAHGTNPATAALAGYDVVPIASDGVLTLAEVEAHMTDEVAALMVTNPNTLGLFETNIAAICELVHAARRPGLLRRRQPQRPARHRPPRRHGDRRDALQPAQDLRHPPRRRRTRFRPGRGQRRPGTVPPRPAWSRRSGQRTGCRANPPVHRSDASLSTATSASWCGPMPTSAPWAAPG